MTESNPQFQSAYKYTPSSSACTRQILDSTAKQDTQTSPPSTTSDSSTSSNKDDSISFRPQIFQRRSSNYAIADAASRIATAETLHMSQSQEKGIDTKSALKMDKIPTSTDESGIGWKPRYGRKQSWNMQDLKRTMQMGNVKGAEGAGFSEINPIGEKS